MYVCMCMCVCVCVRVNVYVYIKSHQMHAASHVHAPAGLLLKKGEPEKVIDSLQGSL